MNTAIKCFQFVQWFCNLQGQPIMISSVSLQTQSPLPATSLTENVLPSRAPSRSCILLHSVSLWFAAMQQLVLVTRKSVPPVSVEILQSVKTCKTILVWRKWNGQCIQATHFLQCHLLPQETHILHLKPLQSGSKWNVPCYLPQGKQWLRHLWSRSWWLL